MMAAKENIMPIANILFLAGTIAAFAVFAAVLAWGEYQTRHLDRHCERDRGQTQPAGSSRLSNVIVRSIGGQVSIAARSSASLDKVTN